MAKGNLFMGTAHGKVGSVVLYRRDGSQVSRSRVEKISNPQSIAQMLNRVVVATVGKAYGFFKPLSDHGFQGYSGAAANMRQFQRLNNAFMGGKAREAYRSSTMGQVSEYAGKDTLGSPVNDYIITTGDIASASYSVSGLASEGILLNVGSATPSYADVIEASGLKVGDQLTFVQATAVDGLFARLVYARVILQPSDGDLTAPFVADGAINKPNVKNEGTDQFTFTMSQQGNSLNVALQSTLGEEVYAGGCLIVSRYEGGWKRSTESFQAVATGPIVMSLQAAIDSWTKGATSGLYLNQSNESFTEG